MSTADLLVVGAGPAGMCAAIEARRHGLEVVVVDEQSSPGGQIWRSVELSKDRDRILGPTYVEGRELAGEFRGCGALYLPGAQLWQMEPGYRAFVSQAGCTEIVDARTVVLATGAQERPVPFPGWTLPGVLTVGAAQILLKSAGQIPTGPVWIAGSGPLPLLYAAQLLRAGGNLAGYLDTTPVGQWRTALRHLPAALRASGDLMKGLGWQSAVRTGSPIHLRGVGGVAAIGSEQLEAVRYRTSTGELRTAAARTLLVHEGVVPSIHAALSLNCEMRWSPAQDCFEPVIDEWGETSCRNLFIAGDGAGIAGARAALSRGRLAGLAAARRLGRIGTSEATKRARPIHRQLRQDLAVRPFLDALFRPRSEVFAPPGETIVCRCEEVTAAQIRTLAAVGCPGPNQIKAATRAGMGPCQGRQCGYSLTRILSQAQGRSPEEVGYLNIRPPLKPVTLGEFAALAQPPDAGPSVSPSIAEE